MRKAAVRVVAAGVLGIILVGAWLLFSRASAVARELFLDPALTRPIAREAIGPDWELTQASCNKNLHWYVFQKDGERRDVNVIRGTDGQWSAKVTTYDKGTP